MADQNPPNEALAAPGKQDKLIVVSQGRPAYPSRAKEAFGITPGDWLALVDAVFPSAKTTEGVELALAYCRARNLDVFKRPVHIVPIWNGKLQREVESVWSGIGELRTTASRTRLWAGNDPAEFGPEETRTFKGTSGKGQQLEKTIKFPAWCSIVVYKVVAGQRVPFPGPKVYWLETYATLGKADVPNEMWETRPNGQLEKCAEAAALRRAFPEEIGEYIVEEAGRRQPVIDIQPIVEAGPKAARLAAKLRKDPESESDPAEGRDQEAPEPTETVAETLSASQLAEVLDLAERMSISLDDLEGEFGGRLDKLVMPGKSSKELEQEIVGTIRRWAGSHKTAQVQSAEAIEPEVNPGLFEESRKKSKS